MANLCDILEISKFINGLEEKTVTSLKQVLEKNGHHNLAFKETDDLVLAHHNKFGESELELTNLEKQCRNVIFDKKTLTPLCYYFDEIVYNPETLDDSQIKNAVVQESIEGTTLLCFYFGNRWYTSTRRCIDAATSMWIRGTSYESLMQDVLCSNMLNFAVDPQSSTISDDDKRNTSTRFFDLLDKNLYYFFALIHPVNKNIVKQDKTKCLVHYMTRKLGTATDVEIPADNKLYEFENGVVIKSKSLEVHSFAELQNRLNQMNQVNLDNKGIVHEGLVVRNYNSDGTCKLIKFQTDKYLKAQKIKPNNSNEYQSYLELYKKDNLTEYLDLCTNKNGINKAKIIKRIADLMLNVSTELLILYHKTRNHQNEQTYNALTKIYKEVLFKLHGEYKRKCLADPENKNSIKITRDDVYKLLKQQLSTKELCLLLHNRKLLSEKGINLFTRDNSSTSLVTSLIFNN